MTWSSAICASGAAITDIFNRHGTHYGDPIGNIMLDHVSASWGSDQNLDTYRHMYQPTKAGRP